MLTKEITNHAKRIKSGILGTSAINSFMENKKKKKLD